MRVLSLFDKPRAAIMSTGKELMDLVSGKGFSFGDWKQQVDEHYGFGQFQQEYMPWIEDAAVPDWVPGLGGKKILRYLTAFTGDVLMDPYTYMGGLGLYLRGRGATNVADDLLRYAAKADEVADAGKAMVARKAVEEMGKGLLKNTSRGIRHLRRHGGEVGQEIMEDMGMSPGLRWRVPLTGPALGRLGRRIAPNAIARRQAAAVPKFLRDEIAEFTGLRGDALTDLIRDSALRAAKDEKIGFHLIEAAEGAKGLAKGGRCVPWVAWGWKRSPCSRRQ